MVSDSVGVSAIETEQCREQEQEKEQEQEQEQEIEMERYVDMAYQRDGEEPTRWAFRTLGDVAAADAPTLRRRAAAVRVDGTFYPASRVPAALALAAAVPAVPRDVAQPLQPRLARRAPPQERGDGDGVGAQRRGAPRTLPPSTSTLSAASSSERLQNVARPARPQRSRGAFGVRELREALLSAEDLQLSDGDTS